jgi:hypothetical protein
VEQLSKVHEAARSDLDAYMLAELNRAVEDRSAQDATRAGERAVRLYVVGL